MKGLGGRRGCWEQGADAAVTDAPTVRRRGKRVQCQ